MINVLRACMLLATIFALGCSGQSERPYVQPEDRRGLVDRLRGSQSEPEALPERTPQFIAGLKTPTLEVTLEQSGQVALLSPFSDRQDATPGEVRIWRAADESQIVLRDGVLISTRGLGPDIESTFSRTMVAMLSAQGSLQGLHRLYLVTGENGTEAVDLTCRTEKIDDDVIEIGARTHVTRRLRADCASDFGKKVYEFWVAPDGQTVWQSRQWAGPGLGYMRLRLLKD